nr:HAD family phosphatase [uncultured Devosia sp.]
MTAAIRENSEIKVTLVDLDGTLVDTHAANLAAYRQAIVDAGVAPLPGALEHWVGRLAWRPMLAKVLPDHADLHEAIALRKRVIYPQYFAAVAVNQALVQTLRALSGPVRIALVTSASRQSVEPLLAAKGLADLFALTICSDDVVCQKPDPEPYRRAAEILGVAPQDCVIFEDSETGVAAARAFGAQTWQVHWPQSDKTRPV